MEGVEILKGIKIMGKALWLAKEKILVISDLHIGYEQALNEMGILVPRAMFREIEKELRKLLKLKPKTIVINGDLKHEFGSISRQEWQETNKIIEMLSEKSNIVLIKGNHDTILLPLAERKNVYLRDYYIVKDICFMHGHRIFDECFSKGVKTIVLGHRHPAIVLRDKVKSETYKCFLVGRYKNKSIIIMPSFFPLVEGSDVSAEFLEGTNLAFKMNLRNFRVYVVGDKAYDFGRMRNMKRLV